MKHGERTMISTENIGLILEKSNENVDLTDSEVQTELYQSMSFESLLFSLLRIIKDDKYGIQLEKNSLIVPAKNKLILSQINNLIEALCNISITFEYDEVKQQFVADFNYLNSEIDLLF